MAFSFNWAGVNVPQIQVKDQWAQSREDLGNLGKALRGYEIRQANKEYADIIEGRNKSLARMDEISNRIAQLQKRNDEIRAQLSGMQQTAVQPDLGYRGEDIYPGGVAVNLDPNLMQRQVPAANVSGIPVGNVFGG